MGKEGTPLQLMLFDEKVRPEAPQVKTPEKSRKEVFNDYEAFTDKFVPKKTTDDCYTPEAVYDAVLEFVGTITPLAGRSIVRPFFPGGDFLNHVYPEDCIVVDNPPFSILAKIIRFYCAHSIPFFLFGPSLTLFTATDCDVTYIIANADITYENGASVNTGFITNLCKDIRLWICPTLRAAIKEAQATPSKKKRGLVYPDNIVTAATLQKLAAHDTELIILKQSCRYIRDSDSAKAEGQSLYGGGYILSDRAAAERAAAERAAAERAAAERAEATKWKLSDRERKIQQMIGRTS